MDAAMDANEQELLDIVCYPDERLRKQCKLVREIDDVLVETAEQMLETMYSSEGIGLAAPQVGLDVSLVVLDVDLERKGNRIWLNPKIISMEGVDEGDEGCLSVPGVRGVVRRAEKIKVRAYDPKGRCVEMKLDGLPARAWQHETDHLHGVLFVDLLSPVSRFHVRGQLKELENQAKNEPR